MLKTPLLLALSLMLAFSGAPASLAADVPDAKAEAGQAAAESKPASADAGTTSDTKQTPTPTAVPPADTVTPASAAPVAPASAAAATGVENNTEPAAASLVPSPAAAKKTVKEEISEIDADRSKVLSLMAQASELISPLPQLQQQVQLLDRLLGRTNGGVVILYNLITTYHYRRAFANGQYAEAAKMCDWMLDTEARAKGTIDEFLAAHTQLQLADLDRKLGKYRESIDLLNKSIPMLTRGNKAAKKLVTDFKTMESPVDKARSADAKSHVKAIVASKQKYYDELDKQLAATKYNSTTELGDIYFVMASDYAQLDNLPKASEYLAMARSHGMTFTAKNRSFSKELSGGGKGGPAAKPVSKPKSAVGAKHK
jgi:tetratricopeptide (TPR) repeat protein